MLHHFPTPQLDVPDSPPPEVLAEVDLAWERSSALAASGLDLHFELTVDGVHAQLRTAGGAVLDDFSAAAALAFACGDAMPACEPVLAA